MQLCGHCKAPCKRRCTLCESAYFCSPEHFRAEWPVHKLECYVKPPKDAMQSSGLHRGKVTGILFAEDADEPRMVQLNTLSGYTQKLQTWQTINMHPYLPDNEKKGRANGRLDGPMVPRGGVTMGLMSEIFYKKDFYKDGSRRNRCVERLTKGKMFRRWSGPFIVLRRTHLNTFYDADMKEDLPMMKFFFTTGQMNGFKALEDELVDGKKKRGNVHYARAMFGGVGLLGIIAAYLLF